MASGALEYAAEIREVCALGGTVQRGSESTRHPKEFSETPASPAVPTAPRGAIFVLPLQTHAQCPFLPHLQPLGNPSHLNLGRLWRLRDDKSQAGQQRDVSVVADLPSAAAALAPKCFFLSSHTTRLRSKTHRVRGS